MTYSFEQGIKQDGRSKLAIVAAIILSAGMLIATLVRPAGAVEPNTVVVTPSDTKGWVVTDTDALSSVNYVADTSTRFGDGALQLLTTADSAGDKATYAVPVANLDLDLVNNMVYDAKRTSGSLQDFQTVSYQLTLDYNGAETGGFTTIVFEPIYTYGNDAVALTAGTWQTWDAYQGGEAKWWSTREIPGAPAFDTQNVTWNDIKTANPNAVINGLYVNYGSGAGAFNGLVDGVTLNDTTYDFEVTAPKPVKATNKDECKNGNWMDGFQTAYKNQGQCVSSVASNKNN